MNVPKQHQRTINQLELQRKRIAKLEEQIDFLFETIAKQSNKLETVIQQIKNKKTCVHY